MSQTLRSRQSRRRTILYLASDNPSLSLNAVATGSDNPSCLYHDYIQQFAETCRRRELRGVIVFDGPKLSRCWVDGFRVYSVPYPLAGPRPYVIQHLRQVIYGFCIALIALIERAAAVILWDGFVHYATYLVIRCTGARVVPSYHTTLWECFSGEPDHWERVARVLKRTLTHHCDVILSASDVISTNIRSVTAGRSAPIDEFLPVYRRETLRHDRFDGRSGRRDPGTFEILVAGRLIESKGVLDAVRTLATLRSTGIQAKLRFCGAGRAVPDIRTLSRDLGVDHAVTFDGKLDAQEMLDRYHGCDVVFVPTTTRFREGFNQVSVEGVLLGKPVVVTDVCPSTRVLGSSVHTVEPGDVDGYSAALARVSHDRHQPRLSPDVRAEHFDQFFDAERGWGAALERALVRLGI